MREPFLLQPEDVLYVQDPRVPHTGLERPQRPEDESLVEALLGGLYIKCTTLDGQVEFSWHPNGYFLLNPTEGSGIEDVQKSGDGYKSRLYNIHRAAPLFCEVDKMSEVDGGFQERYRILFTHAPPEKL